MFHIVVDDNVIVESTLCEVQQFSQHDELSGRHVESIEVLF